ncbi:MAG: DUF488 domain-containing protein [Anaerolineae bacterium]
MKIYTIGFTQKSAQEFFELLARNHVTAVLDVRRHATSQLAGFTKQNDLRYFLKTILNADYRHALELAPDEEVLKEYRKTWDWEMYRREYAKVLKAANVPDSLDKQWFVKNNVCLLCTEPKPDGCHRLLLAERLKEAWGDVEITHL